MKTRQLTAMMACCGIVLLHTLAGQAKDMVGENDNRTARQMPSMAGEETAYQYKIVKSLDDIVAGDGYLITYDAKSYVMGPIGSNHYGTVLTATFDKVNGFCTTTSDRNDLTIEINDDGYLLLKNSDGYIRHSSTDHQLATADEPATRAFEWKAESVSAYGNIKISNRPKTAGCCVSALTSLGCMPVVAAYSCTAALTIQPAYPCPCQPQQTHCGAVLYIICKV